MTLISISNFFEMASLFFFATYFLRPCLTSFQCFARALFCLNSSMFRSSISISAPHVSCSMMVSINVICCAESMLWVLPVESDGHEEIDWLRVASVPSDGSEVDELFAMNCVCERKIYYDFGFQDVLNQAIIPHEGGTLRYKLFTPNNRTPLNDNKYLAYPYLSSWPQHS